MFSMATIAIAALMVTANGYSGNGTPVSATAENNTRDNTIFDSSATSAAISSHMTAPAHLLHVHRIVCVGDSITEGFANPNNWPYQLKARLGEDWEVIDQGFGGAKTADMRDRIDASLELDPHFVIIMGGINDLAKRESLETIEGNIGAMCTRVESHGAVPVLCTVTPSGDYLTQKDDLNAWITDYAHSKGYDLIDFYAVLNDKSNPGHPDHALVFDGTHPNLTGYTAMANAVDLGIFMRESSDQS
ncbi:MAG: GDSL-type esterase/lipase family protein [Halobacteriota archaeon]